MRRVESIWYLFSISLLALIALFSLIRFNYLPQFVDGYYHLSCANALIKSGGWVGVDWWHFAPVGRPYLYPPLYHLLLAALKSCGLTGLTLLRITEVLITPCFFFVIWYVVKARKSDRFAFLFLLLTSSFFTFYSSVSGNLPASLAIIFGFLTWHLFTRGKLASAIALAAVSFYTHSAISWIFIISWIFLAVFNRQYRRSALKLIFISLLLAVPIIYHQLVNWHYLNFSILGETYLIQYSLAIIILGILGLLINFRPRVFNLLFLGYFCGSIIVFFNYPYRFFSAQGVLALAFFATCFIEYLGRLLPRRRQSILIILVLYLFIFHPTLEYRANKLKVKGLNSSYFNIASGKFIDTLKFNPIFYPQYYMFISKIIDNNTDNLDIISSNLKPISQVFSAISNRPTSYPLLAEVESFHKFNPYRAAKFIVWVKFDLVEAAYWQQELNLKPVYENEFAVVFLNPNYKQAARLVPAVVSFKLILLIFLCLLAVLFLDNRGLLAKVFNKPYKH